MTDNKILKINNLNVSFKNKIILNNLNLEISLGETHILMGQNGAGKSTLANVLIGNHKSYKINGSVLYHNTDILSIPQEEIALNGIFLSFQHPIEIPGLSNYQFFKSFINNKRKYEKINPIENSEFLLNIKEKMAQLNIKEEFLNRGVNEGFSGGEKKKNEILQMLLINPKLAILDEIDSGLDVDSIKNVFDAINKFKNKENSLLIITHYSKILSYLNIDMVHILCDGTIIKSGNKEIVAEVEKNGFPKKK